MTEAKGGEHMATKKTNTNQSKSMQPKQMATKAKRTVKKVGRKGGAAMLGTAAGAVVGAALGGAAGAALADKNTRHKMGNSINEFSKAASQTAEKLSQSAENLSQTARRTVDQVADDTQRLERKTKTTH